MLIKIAWDCILIFSFIIMNRVSGGGSMKSLRLLWISLVLFLAGMVLAPPAQATSFPLSLWRDQFVEYSFGWSEPFGILQAETSMQIDPFPVIVDEDIYVGGEVGPPTLVYPIGTEVWIDYFYRSLPGGNHPDAGDTDAFSQWVLSRPPAGTSFDINVDQTNFSPTFYFYVDNPDHGLIQIGESTNQISYSFDAVNNTFSMKIDEAVLLPTSFTDEAGSRLFTAHNLKSIPEPTALTLLVAGALGLLGWGWRRKKR
jgi:hypothetical protein